jgi:hypothetical protein
MRTLSALRQSSEHWALTEFATSIGDARAPRCRKILTHISRPHELIAIIVVCATIVGVDIASAMGYALLGGQARREEAMGYRMGRLFSGMAAVFAALHGFTVWAGEPQRSALEGVPGLEKRVTYAETKIPLGELVEKIAADTGCPLTAARAVADEPVALAVTDFPARDLLQELADLFDYRWRRPSSAVRIAYSVSDKGGRAFDFSGYAIRSTPETPPSRSIKIWPPGTARPRSGSASGGRSRRASGKS